MAFRHDLLKKMHSEITILAVSVIFSVEDLTIGVRSLPSVREVGDFGFQMVLITSNHPL